MEILKNTQKTRKNVTCNVCGRSMTVRDYEHPPYYCYQCDEENESIHQ